MLKSHAKFHSAGGKRLILVADDEMINRMLLGGILENDYELIYAADGREALDKIRENREILSLVLLDLMMPVMSGLELLRILKEDPDLAKIPVIVVTSDQAAEIESLTLGAIDFIPKPYPQAGVIQARVLRTIELSEDRQIIQSTERDPLTGLYNREYFYRYAEQFDQHHKDLSMDALVLDVNHFHMINERFGAAYGDEILRRIGERVRDMVRDTGGIVCRREADTFMVYCPHGKDYRAILENASVGLAGDDSPNNRVRLRMGVYADADKSLDIARRFDRAKIAADTVRNSFTRTIGLYDNTLHEQELFAEQLIEDFHRALEERQFKVFYQPKYDVRPETPALASAEALVRWFHPDFGTISPGVFIPLFEDNGMIRDLDNYVWRTAAAQIRDWRDRLGFSTPVSVNVSRIDMYDPCLIDTFRQLLAEYDLDPGDILLEITESAYTQDSEQIIETVNSLRALGFRIEMDDFGTGYSSLNMISALPIDALKLDMQFVRSAFSQRKDTRLLEAIIDIADYLAVPVIAEGVETEEQLRALRDMGCDLVQGYYFSRPVPPEEYERFLIARRDQPDPAPPASADGDAALPDPAPAAADDAGLLDFDTLARALTSDMESIYYVNTVSGAYLEFVSAGSYGSLKLEISGERFFDECQRNIPAAVYADDREKVAAALEKDALLAALEQRGAFCMDYRLMIVGRPVYYRMKVIPAGSGRDGHIILGVSNIDAQITRDARLEAERRSAATYSRIAQALAADYFSIYYVDTDTGRFIEYISRRDHTGLGVEQSGEDFFTLIREKIRRTVHPEDQEMVAAAMRREYLMAALEQSGTFTLTYRLMIDREPTYVHLKASRMGGGGDPHIVIGVSNIHAQMKREQEQAVALRNAREAANRDPLTGVKSKHAFLEAEQRWNERIARNGAGSFAVVYCDLNGLKTVNDTRGHKAGDQYIKDACSVICHTFQHSPVYRIGGDEFTVILSGADYADRAALMERFREENRVRAEQGGVDLAFGISEFDPEKDGSIEAVVERSDAIMYGNKNARRAGR